MKKITDVLDHFVSQPIYSRLRGHNCFRRIKEALPPALRKGIMFMYIEDGTLFLALRHPAFKMEFDYKLNLIKNLLTTLPPLQEACESMQIEKIRTFVSRYAPLPSTAPADSEPRYKERAAGRFDVAARHPEITETLESIRRLIEDRRRL